MHVPGQTPQALGVGGLVHRAGHPAFSSVSISWFWPTLEGGLCNLTAPRIPSPGGRRSSCGELPLIGFPATCCGIVTACFSVDLGPWIWQGCEGQRNREGPWPLPARRGNELRWNECLDQVIVFNWISRVGQGCARNHDPCNCRKRDRGGHTSSGRPAPPIRAARSLKSSILFGIASRTICPGLSLLEANRVHMYDSVPCTRPIRFGRSVERTRRCRRSYSETAPAGDRHTPLLRSGRDTVTEQPRSHRTTPTNRRSK